MNLKLLDAIKSFNYSNDELLQLINSSYFYFYKHSLPPSAQLEQDPNKQKIFSNLVRFYRSINTNKKIEEGLLQTNLKELFKNNSTLVESLTEKVNEISSIQTIRLNYADTKSFSRLFVRQSDINIKSPCKNIITAMRSYKNMSFKINVTVSNKDSNRVLTPEIILIFTLDGGERVTMQIDIKLFQELRRALAYHIKKIIDNEGVTFLRN